MVKKKKKCYQLWNKINDDFSLKLDFGLNSQKPSKLKKDLLFFFDLQRKKGNGGKTGLSATTIQILEEHAARFELR